MDKKKGILIVLAFIVMITLVSCSSQSLEAHSRKHSIRYRISDTELYDLDFDNGTVTISHNFYDRDPSSVSGYRINIFKSQDYTYSYTNTGNGQIECNGQTYFYTISDYNSVTFAPAFMGISEYWVA